MNIYILIGSITDALVHTIWPFRGSIKRFGIFFYSIENDIDRPFSDICLVCMLSTNNIRSKLLSSSSLLVEIENKY